VENRCDEAQDSRLGKVLSLQFQKELISSTVVSQAAGDHKDHVLSGT
jgi:hypothetical protein